jgi:hypothetical protein
VYAEQGRTLCFELDHREAKARLDCRDDFDVLNIVTACRSCNVLKGQMDVERFRAEVQSLAKAIIGQSGSSVI